VAAHTCISSIWEAQAGFKVCGQFGLHRVTLPPKIQNKTKTKERKEKEKS
jgi:hypothetical protein